MNAHIHVQREQLVFYIYIPFSAFTYGEHFFHQEVESVHAVMCIYTLDELRLQVDCALLSIGSLSRH